jgi:hypothetical protein
MMAKVEMETFFIGTRMSFGRLSTATQNKWEGNSTSSKQIFNYHLNSMSPETIFSFLLHDGHQDEDTFAAVNGLS